MELVRSDIVLEESSLWFRPEAKYVFCKLTRKALGRKPDAATRPSQLALRELKSLNLVRNNIDIVFLQDEPDPTSFSPPISVSHPSHSFIS
ncbi:hypothetical protein CRYUN_Cryun41cG0016300 [Craigia yunnanensis]